METGTRLKVLSERPEKRSVDLAIAVIHYTNAVPLFLERRNTSFKEKRSGIIVVILYISCTICCDV